MPTAASTAASASTARSRPTWAAACGGEEALAVAIQSDGKIVVVGYDRRSTPRRRRRIRRRPSPSPATTATARSTPASARAAGSAATSTASPARWRSSPTARSCWRGTSTIQLSNGTFASDIVVARFNANGSLDLPFGTSGTGQVATDVGSATNSGAQRRAATQWRDRRQRHAAVQAGQPGCNHTDVVRYNANGTLDASFGSGGKLTLADVDVGAGPGAAGRRQAGPGGHACVQATAPATARSC